MILNLLNMIFALIIFYGAGSLICNRLIKMKSHSIDLILASGICGCGIYAECYSIFSGVGIVALAVITLLALAEILYECIKQPCWGIAERIRTKYEKNRKLFFACASVVLILLIYYSFVCAGTVRADDDYGYHIQGIKWINEYGTVPGQGLLHFRFGFNSAFLSLQALFNWHFWGYPFHTVNCLCAALFTAYCLFSLRKPGEGKIISCVAKLSAIWVTLYVRESLIGVETDPLALIFFMYIIIKLVDTAKAGESDNRMKIVISTLACYAFTLKLSVAPLLAYSALVFIFAFKEKRYKELLILIISALVCILPFLIRSAIITGYILYPLTSFDILAPDWKIPESINIGCMMGIVIWGRGTQGLIINDHISWEEVYNLKITEWFPIWFNQLSMLWKCIFIFFVVSFIVWLIVFVVSLIRKSKVRLYYVPIGLCTICTLYWLFSAPAIRFGGPMMVLFGALTAGALMELLNIRRLGTITCSLIILCGICQFFKSAKDTVNEHVPSFRPREYNRYFVDAVYFPAGKDGGDGAYLYASSESNAGFCDPYYFPVTNDTSYFQILELRGDGIRDGFRVKMKDYPEGIR